MTHAPKGAERSRLICGIAGYSLSPKESPVNSRRLAAALLLSIEHRGKDATGAAWRLPNGGIEVQKRAVPARQFVRRFSAWRRTRQAILHTRFATNGHQSNNFNNHPVTAGPIIGVHNGVIYNDYELYREMGIVDRRVGKVDSEAIFAAIAWSMEKHPERRTRLQGATTPVVSALEAIEGSAAIAWFDAQEDGILNLASISSSPLFIGNTKAGSLLFASTKDAILDSARSCGLEIVYLDSVDEGVWLQVKDGAIVREEKFIPYWECYTGHRTWEQYRDNAWQSNAVTPIRQGWDDDEKVSVLMSDGSMSTVPATTGTVVKADNGYVHEEPNRYSDMDLASMFLEERCVIRNNPQWYASAYVARERNIANYFEGSDRNSIAFLSDQFELHALARPGDWVETTVNGQTTMAQVYLLPTAFPEGSYVLRIFVPNSNREGGWEVMFCERGYHEFTSLDRKATEAIESRIDELTENEELADA